MNTPLILILTTISLLISSEIFAQNYKKSTIKDYSTYAEKLKLSEKQIIEFDKINQHFEAQVDALKDEFKNKNYKGKIKALEIARDKKIKELFSKKQFKKFVELRRKERKNLQGLIRKPQ